MQFVVQSPTQVGPEGMRMKFTLLSHAGMLIEAADIKRVSDPFASLFPALPREP